MDLGRVVNWGSENRGELDFGKIKPHRSGADYYRDSRTFRCELSDLHLYVTRSAFCQQALPQYIFLSDAVRYICMQSFVLTYRASGSCVMTAAVTASVMISTIIVASDFIWFSM